MNLSYMYQYCTLDISHQPSGVTGQLHLMTSWQLQQPSKDNKLTTVLTNCTLLFSEDRYWPIDGPIFLGARLVYLSRPNLLVCWALIRVAQNVSRPAVPIFLKMAQKSAVSTRISTVRGTLIHYPRPPGLTARSFWLVVDRGTDSSVLREK